jgi:hypothetical protein
MADEIPLFGGQLNNSIRKVPLLFHRCSLKDNLETEI